jgi:hypothetical protein
MADSDSQLVSDSNSTGNKQRGETIRTYIVSVPVSSKPPKVKKGHIHQLVHDDTIQDIEKHIDDVEAIVQNIQVINIECSKCVGSFKNIFNNCRLKSKVTAI